MTDTGAARLGPFAIVVPAVMALLAAATAGTAAAGLTDVMAMAALVAAATAAAAVWWSTSHATLAAALPGVPRPFRLAFMTGAVAALLQLAVLTAFIVDPSVDRWPASVARPWQSAHSCVSAYWVAARQATVAPDLYREAVYRPVIAADVPRQPNLGPFFVDVFEYPPTFLPLPRLLAAITPDFWGFRRLWFALNPAGVGWTPMLAFADHLPKILGGEAFPGLSRPPAIAINESVPGIVFKLGLFGVPGMGFGAAQIAGWLYTIALAAATAWFALRWPDRRLDPLAWIAILILATLRSPFLPGYGAFPALWLATLIMAVACTRPRIGVAASLLWLALALHVGQGTVPPTANAVLTFAHTLASLLLVGVVLPRLMSLPVPRSADVLVPA